MRHKSAVLEPTVPMDLHKRLCAAHFAQFHNSPMLQAVKIVVLSEYKVRHFTKFTLWSSCRVGLDIP